MTACRACTSKNFYAVGDAAEQIVKLTGTTAKLRVGARPERAHDLRDLVARVERAHELLDWQPSADLADGLRRTVDWYRSVPARTA